METIKEGFVYHKINNQQLFTTSEKSFNAGVEFAQRWIPVEEELPDDFSSVLVRNNNNSIRSIAIFLDDIFTPDFSCLNHSQVTHWRPIERV